MNKTLPPTAEKIIDFFATMMTFLTLLVIFGVTVGALLFIAYVLYYFVSLF